MDFFLNAFVILNLSILVLILGFKKDKSRSTAFLMFILATPILNFLVNILILKNFIHHVPWIIYITQMTVLLFGPLVYGYVRTLQGKAFFKKDWLYLISVLGLMIDFGMLINFLMQPQVYKNEFSELLTSSDYPLDINITNMVFMSIQTIYFIKMWKGVLRYEKKLKRTHSEIEGYKISYLKEFVLVTNVLNFLTIMMYLTLETMWVEYYILPAVITLLFSYFLFSAFNHSVVFSESEYESLLEKIKDTRKAEKTLVSSASKNENPQELGTIFSSIEKFVKKEQGYLDAQLSILELAEIINEPQYKVSKAINTNTNNNFHDYINKIRIEKAEELLLSPSFDGYMEQLAYDVGFNSRASFYRAFKKYTGKAPKELLEEKTTAV